MSKRVKYMGSGDLETQFTATDTAADTDKRLVAQTADSFEDLFTLEDLIEKLSFEQDWSWEEAGVTVIRNMRCMIDAGLAVVYNVED